MKKSLEKQLLRNGIDNWLAKGYKVDIRNGFIRGLEYHAKIESIKISDTDFSEDYFNEMIQHEKLDNAFSKSEHHVTTNFKTTNYKGNQKDHMANVTMQNNKALNLQDIEKFTKNRDVYSVVRKGAKNVRDAFITVNKNTREKGLGELRNSNIRLAKTQFIRQKITTLKMR